MLALRKILGGVDPHQGMVKIQYTPRVEAIAYPHFTQHSSSIGPHTTEPENYSYILEAACNATYVAEGSISFPALTGGSCYFAFKTSTPWNREWHLTLGEDATRIAGTAHEYVVKEFLHRTDLGRPSQRNDLADIIARNIRSYFDSDDCLIHGKSGSTNATGTKFLDDYLRKIEEFVRQDYLPLLQESLRIDPQQVISPLKYLYELGPEEVPDKSKLKRI